jgi:hypothetical protein
MKCKKTGSARIEIAENFSIIVSPYLWKLVKSQGDNNSERFSK